MKRTSRRQTKKKKSGRKAKTSSKRKVTRKTRKVVSRQRARPLVRRTARKARTKRRVVRKARPKPRVRKRAPRRARATRKRKTRARKAVRKVKTRALQVKKPIQQAVAPQQGTQVGVIQHYYTNLSVGVMDVTSGEVKVGDKIRIVGATTNFTQVVKSLQLEHQSIDRVTAGQSVGIKVDKHVREHDKVYKV